MDCHAEQRATDYNYTQHDIDVKTAMDRVVATHLIFPELNLDRARELCLPVPCLPCLSHE